MHVEETKIAHSKKDIREQKKAETRLRNAINTKRIKTLTMTPGTALSRPSRIAKSKAMSYKELVSDSDNDDLTLKKNMQEDEVVSNYSDDDMERRFGGVEDAQEPERMKNSDHEEEPDY
jgi:hypothetical protein